MINLNQPILDIGGKVSQSKFKTTEMKEIKGEMVEVPVFVNKDVTLGSMLRHSVLKTNGDYEIKSVLERYNLFKKLNLSEEGVQEVTFDEDEEALLLRLLCESVETFYAGSIIEILTK